MDNPGPSHIINLFSLRGMPMALRLRRVLFLGVIGVTLFLSVITFFNGIQNVNKPFPGFLVNNRMVIAIDGPSYWTGSQAELKYPDKIISANNQRTISLSDLQAVITAAKPGDFIRYGVERGSRVVEISIPSMDFGWSDLILFFGPEWLIGVIYFFLGIVVFTLKPDMNISWIFLAATVFLGFGPITNFAYLSTHSLGYQIFNFLSTTFLPAASLHLSLLFPEESNFHKKHPHLTGLLYMVSLLLFFAQLLLNLSHNPLVATVYKIVLLYTAIGAMALIASILFSIVKSSSKLARTRAKVVLLGAALAFPLIALLPVLSDSGGFGIVKANLSHGIMMLPTVIFPGSIAYAIARHNLFDVDVYIKRAVGYVVMTIIVAISYFSIQTFASTFVLKPILGENAEKAYPIVFALLVVFLFNPVNRTVQEGVDKMFFRKKFDYKGAVIAASNALSSILNLNEIILQVIHTVRKEIFIDSAGVILFEPQKKGCQSYFIEDGPGQVKDQSKEVCILYDDPLLALVSREKKLITKYDIAEDPRYSSVKESCGQRFAEMAASLAIPLIYQDEVKGVLALGYKKSGNFYSREDIDLLNTLASQAAVAIENAKMAEQMKKEETVRTNLARYLSPQIVDQIIQKDVKVNLGGDRKVVTVLFSDIRNFTTITESRPADQLVQILNEYFTEMAGIIFENQGSLDKYIGDAIVAVFGSLIPLENSAPYAVTAAIEMMKRLPALNERWIKEYGFTMNIGIGINTGEVFLGNIGSPERMEFTVIGDTVNVASRFSGLAKPGQILMTRETLAYLGSDINYKELPATEVKGKTGKLNVFEIIYT
jgi:class 3 adenylate cyclase